MIKLEWKWTAAFLCLMGLVVGCAPPAMPAVTPAGPLASPAPATPTPAVERTMPLRRLTGEEAVAEARRLLARRVGVPVAQVEVVSVSREEMPIDDLGCPPTTAPEGRRAPGIVFGQVIVLRVEEREYEFRGDGRRLILCRVGEETVGEQVWPEPEAEGKAPDPQRALVDQAIADLARRLQVSPEAVQVRRVEAVEWPDTSLGCPEPGMMYAQVITPGYRIILAVGEELHEYHASRSRVIYCPR